MQTITTTIDATIITKEEIDGYCDTIITVNALTSLLKINNISESAKTEIEPGPPAPEAPIGCALGPQTGFVQSQERFFRAGLAPTKSRR